MYNFNAPVSVLKPIDELINEPGAALADAGYQWTQEQVRQAYEAASAVVTPKGVGAWCTLPPDVAEWLKTLEWVGPISDTVIQYPAGRPDGMTASKRHDYYEARASVSPDEVMYLQITDTTYDALFDADLPDHPHLPDRHSFEQSNG